MCDNKFWLFTSLIFSLLFIAILYISTDYWKNHNTKIVTLIQEGVSPTEAMCALQDDYGTHPVCVIHATKQPL